MKISTMQIIRRISQILSLLFFTGIFSLAFSGFQKLLSILTTGNFKFSEIQAALAPLIFVAALTIIFGRVFCGWFCAFGAVNDFIYLAAQKIFKKHLKNRVKPGADSRFKALKYFILAGSVICGWLLKLKFINQIDPWTAFARIGTIFSGGLTINLGLLLLLGILIGSAFIERFFCRYLCPLGAILSLLGKIKILKIVKPVENCRACKLCGASCPMGIDLSSTTTVNSGECIGCLQCVSVCPQSNARMNLLTRSFNTLTYAFSAILIFILFNLSGKWLDSSSNPNPALQDKFPVQTASVTQYSPSTPAPSNKPSEWNATVDTSGQSPPVSQAIETPAPTPIPQENVIYRDGVYYGVATGFRPGLQVAVTLKADRITDIQIVTSREDPRFLWEPARVIPAQILKSQSTNVDVVSGATFTSRGIMAAVEDALQQARNDLSV